MSESDFFTATQLAFAPLNLSSPQLQEKLLKKPPFRFIYDLIRAVNKHFGIFSTAIPPELSEFSKIESKDQKIEYLTAIISQTEKLLNVKIDVNPKKIVSGNEPEKTNVFLQCIAKAAAAVPKNDHSPRSNSPTGKKSKSASPSQRKSNSPSPSSKKVSASSPRAAASVMPATSPTKNTTNLITPSGEALDVSNLPKAVKSAKASSSAIKKVIDDARNFQDSIGRSTIDLTAPFDVVADGKKIAEMWNTLGPSKKPITQSNIPEDALETAILRQIASARQIQELNSKNNKLIKHLETLIMQ